MELNKIGRMALLSDFYSELLTNRQQEVIKYYYEQDLSLGEIAENLHITRQGVHDILKRADNNSNTFLKFNLNPFRKGLKTLDLYTLKIHNI